MCARHVLLEGVELFIVFYRPMRIDRHNPDYP